MKRTNLRNIKPNGFTLVEVLVTLVITSVGILGISILQLEALKASQDAITRTKAINLASDMADRIRANREALNFENRNTYIATNAAAGAAPNPNCLDIVQAYDPANQVSCNPAELALYDIWEWKNLLANSASGIAGNQVNGTITRANTLSAAGDQLTNVIFTITINWQNAREPANQARSYVLQFQP